MVDKEFEENVRKITQILDKDGNICYGLCLIGHEKVRIDSDGQTSIKYITPDVSERCGKIINRMVDLTAYIGMFDGNRYIIPRQIVINEGSQTTNIYAGSHFANLNNKIELGYESLVNAIAEAMATDSTGKTITLSDAPVAVQQEEHFNYKDIMNSIKKIVKTFMKLDEPMTEPVHMATYKTITEEILGQGRLVKDCTESQVELLSLILTKLEAYVKDNNINLD